MLKLSYSIITKPIINNILKYTFNADKKLTSKQIEQKIRQEKWKNLQNNFKTIKTYFGLVRPTTISQNYTKPDKIEYNLQSLRICSRQYPHYLHDQLNKHNSHFKKVINQQIQKLWKAQKKQALQFLQFLSKWNISNNGVSQRLFSKLELNIQDLFYIIKWQPYSSTLENLIIESIQKIDSRQYHALFKILNYLRLNHLGSQTFFISLQKNIKKSITQIPPSALASLAVHYAHNTQENQQSKINILNSIRLRLISVLQFLNQDELIAVFYCYVRADLVSQQLLTTLISRVELIYDQLSPENRKKLFLILSNLHFLERMRILGISQRQLLKKKKLDISLIGDLYLASFQSNMLTDQLNNIFQNLVLENIFVMDAEQVSKSIWVFYSTAKKERCQNLSKKIEIIIEGGLKNYQIKQICMMVWGLCSINYSPKGLFWQNIQNFLQEKLSSPQSGNLSNASYILWTYLNNQALTKKTINLIINIILKQQSQITPFELVNIISFFYSIDQNVSIIIQPIILKHFQLLYKQMTMLQLIKCFRYISLKLSREIYQNIIQIFQSNIQQLTYQQVLICFGILLKNQFKSKKNNQFLKKLYLKIPQFQKIALNNIK